MNRFPAIALLASMVALGQTKMAPPRSPEAAPRTKAKPDVVGWGKIKWGMRISQVRAIYGSQVADPEGENPYTDNLVERLIIKSLMVGDTEMKVSIAASSGTDRVILVSLSPTTVLPSEAASGRSYEDLKTSLIRKYGPPSSTKTTERSGVNSTNVKWIFPSTEITLSWIVMPDLKRGLLDLTYSAADKRMLDVL